MSETKHVPFLDGWRGMAIILVLVAHFSPGYRMLPIGAFGVLLFFVLSGHLMGQLLFVKNTPLPRFFARRFSRIIPLTWLYISVMYIYAAYFMPHPYVPSTAELLSTFIFLGAYFPKDISIWSGHWPIGQLWSLNVEEHSYIFLAIVSIVAAKFKDKISKNVFLVGSVLLVLLMILLYRLEYIQPGASPWRTHSEVASLGLLTAAALAATRLKNDTWWAKAWWMPVVLSILAGLCFFPRTLPFLSLTAAPLCAAVAINYAYNFPQIIKNCLSNSVLRWFGRVSFSIYLWQQPFFELTHQSDLPLLAGLIMAIATGAASFYLIENPVRKYLNEKWDRFEKRRATTVNLKTTQQ